MKRHCTAQSQVSRKPLQGTRTPCSAAASVPLQTKPGQAEHGDCDRQLLSVVCRGAMADTLGRRTLETKAYLIFLTFYHAPAISIFFSDRPREDRSRTDLSSRLCHRGVRVGRLTSAGTSLASWQPPCPVQVAVRPAFYSSLFLVD